MMTMVAVRTMAPTIGRNISANRDTGARSSGGQRHKSYGRHNRSGAGNSGSHTNTERTAAPIAGRTGGSSSTVNMSADGNSTPTQQPINKSQTNQNNQSAFNQNAQNKEKPHRYGKYGLSTLKRTKDITSSRTVIRRYTRQGTENRIRQAIRAGKHQVIQGILMRKRAVCQVQGQRTDRRLQEIPQSV